MTTMESPLEWQEWHRTQEKAVELAIEGDIKTALEVVGHFLTQQLPTAVHATAVAFRGDLLKKVGQLDAAKADYAAALVSGPADSYGRYTVQVALASVCHRLGQSGEAQEWYRRALETALLESDQTGATALRGLADMTTPLDLGQQDLCVRVAQKAWKAAGFAGEPDVTKLRQTAEAIIGGPPKDRG